MFKVMQHIISRRLSSNYIIINRIGKTLLWFRNYIRKNMTQKGFYGNNRSRGTEGNTEYQEKPFLWLDMIVNHCVITTLQAVLAFILPEGSIRELQQCFKNWKTYLTGY